MSVFFITVLLLIGTSLQTILPRPAIMGSIEWPLLLGIVLCVALQSKRSRILFASVFAGILNDVFSPAPLGLSIPFFVLIALGVHAVRGVIFSDQVVTYGVLGLLGGLLQTLYFTTVFVVFGFRSVDWTLWGIRLLSGMLCGLFFTPVLFLLLSALRTRRIHCIRSKR